MLNFLRTPSARIFPRCEVLPCAKPNAGAPHITALRFLPSQRWFPLERNTNLVHHVKLYAAVLAALCLVLLPGCLPHPPLPKAAQIESRCFGCISENVGLAPLSVSLFAAKPEGALSYEWDLGDAQLVGRWLTHSYTSPGHYVVTLQARVIAGAGTVRYEAQTAFTVLAQTANARRFENSLVMLTMIVPESLTLEQVGLVRYVLQAKRDLVYIYLRSVPDNHLYSPESGELYRTSLSAGAVIKFEQRLTGFRSGNGYVQVILQVSDGAESAEINERLPIEVSRSE